MSARPASVEDVFLRSERMVGRRIADEFVLVPLAARGADVDALFNLNAAATFIWEHLDGRTTGAQIVAALVERFDVETEQAGRDYLTLMDQLCAIQAVTRVEPQQT